MKLNLTEIEIFSALSDTRGGMISHDQIRTNTSELKIAYATSLCYKSVNILFQLIISVTGIFLNHLIYPVVHLSKKSANFNSNLILVSLYSGYSIPVKRFLKSNYAVYSRMQERRIINMQ